MDFNAYVTSLGFDVAALTEPQKLALQAEWRKSQAPVAAAPAVVAAVQSESKPANSDSFSKTVAAIEAENARQGYIRERTLAAMNANKGDAEKCKTLRALCEAAIADEKTTAQAYDLSLLRTERYDGPSVFAPSKSQMNDTVLEAALCMTQRLPGVEKKFDERTLEAASKQFKHGLGLQELFMLAAQHNGGYRGSARDMLAVCRAAFNGGGFGGQLMATSGPSALTVPGILANTANKFLAAGFGYGEQSWRLISKQKPANDFKQMSTYRLMGTNKFERVAPGGEIKHGQLSELTYTNQVNTYGKMLGIDRRDYINDDLGAFTGASDELGRGAIESLNEVFWTAWLDDSTFFPTDGSYSNYDAGATDSVLSLAGLDNANTIMAVQTKPNGSPLGVMPKILLCPAALWATAKNLMNGAVTASAQSTATVTTENIWKGMFDVVPSVYLQNTGITGYSSTAWYLLADPQVMAAIEVAFLNGVETPTVETSDFDFDRLGISMRAYMDFGVSKQEYRAGVKLKGAA